MRLLKGPLFFGGVTATAMTALLLAGCNESSPTEPKLVAPTPSASAPTPTPPPPEIWSLTSQVTGATGGFCIYLPDVGSVFRTTFVLQRSGNSVSFLMTDPIDWEGYTATLTGLNFTATIPAFDSGAGMCTHYRQLESLSGSFSEDSRHLSATEVWSFALDSGEVVTRTFHWSASRG